MTFHFSKQTVVKKASKQFASQFSYYRLRIAFHLKGLSDSVTLFRDKVLLPEILKSKIKFGIIARTTLS